MMISAIATTLGSRFTPMPLKIHLPFCIFATLIFLIIWIRRKSTSALIWALICDATLILQFFTDPLTALAVGIGEVVMFILLFILWIRDKISAKKAKKAEGDKPGDPSDRSDIEKLIKSEMQNIAGHNGDDVISSAFEDDRP